MSGLCGLTWRAPGEETAFSGAPKYHHWQCVGSINHCSFLCPLILKKRYNTDSRGTGIYIFSKFGTSFDDKYKKKHGNPDSELMIYNLDCTLELSGECLKKIQVFRLHL